MGMRHHGVRVARRPLIDVDFGMDVDRALTVNLDEGHVKTNPRRPGGTSPGATRKHPPSQGFSCVISCSSPIRLAHAVWWVAVVTCCIIAASTLTGGFKHLHLLKMDAEQSGSMEYSGIPRILAASLEKNISQHLEPMKAAVLAGLRSRAGEEPADILEDQEDKVGLTISKTSGGSASKQHILGGVPEGVPAKNREAGDQGVPEGQQHLGGDNTRTANDATESQSTGSIVQAVPEDTTPTTHQEGGQSGSQERQNDTFTGTDAQPAHDDKKGVESNEGSDPGDLGVGQQDGSMGFKGLQPAGGKGPSSTQQSLAVEVKGQKVDESSLPSTANMSPSEIPRISVTVATDSKHKVAVKPIDTNDHMPPWPSIVIYNNVHFHYEVVAGLLQVLTGYPGEIHLFLHADAWNASISTGALEMLGTLPRKVVPRRMSEVYDIHGDVLIHTSPEYNLTDTKDATAAVRPKIVLSMIHNGDSEALYDVIGLHPKTELLGLGPHVAIFTQKRLARERRVAVPVHWVLPSMERRNNPCLDTAVRQVVKTRKMMAHTSPDTIQKWVEEKSDLLGCFTQGYTVQGNLVGYRRNYSSLWEKMAGLQRKSEEGIRRIRVTVIGRGDEKALGIPEELKGDVQVLNGLPFNQFYDTISRSFALVPLVASPAYYDRKFSSTVITSLTTAIPVLADDKFLQAYRFLRPNTTLYQYAHEDELDAMLRWMKRAPEEVLERRKAVRQEQKHQNNRAIQVIMDVLKKNFHLPL